MAVHHARVEHLPPAHGDAVGSGQLAGVRCFVELGADDIDDLVDDVARAALVEAIDRRAGGQTGKVGLTFPVTAVGHRVAGALSRAEARGDVVGRGELEVLSVKCVCAVGSPARRANSGQNMASASQHWLPA